MVFYFYIKYFFFKLTLEDIRSPVLGNIKFSSLKTQLECDVYDVMDSIINNITMNNEKGGDMLSIKRILCSQIPPQNDSLIKNNYVFYTQGLMILFFI